MRASLEGEDGGGGSVAAGLAGAVLKLPLKLRSRALRPQRTRERGRRRGGGACRSTVGGGESLQTREVSASSRACRGVAAHRIHRAFFGRVAGALTEDSLVPTLPEAVDKIFAACWLAGGLVLAGTKCNKLLEINTEARTSRAVSLPASPSGGQVIEAGCPNLGRRLIAGLGGAGGGIHTVALNPSHTLVSTGGTNVCDCIVLDPIGHRHVCTLVGHCDRLYDSDWMTETRLITASGDGTCKIWDVDGAGEQVCGAMATFRGHGGSSRAVATGDTAETSVPVRAAKYCREGGQVASLGDGLCVWDPNVLRGGSAGGARGLEIELPRASGPVCLSFQPNLVAVGSQHHLLLIDPRVGGIVKCVTPMQSGREDGIRSLSALDNVLSVGSGSGNLSFFDLRRDAFLRVDGGDPDGCPGPWAGGGEGGRHPYCLPLDWPHRPACFTHSWDPSGTRIFAAGGPIFSEAVGVYAAVLA